MQDQVLVGRLGQALCLADSLIPHDDKTAPPVRRVSGGELEMCVRAAVTKHSTPEEKIALFRSLFRGRSDVYPLRFESRRTGRSGYQPACANEWVRGLCEKPRIKCFDCPNRRFLPVTKETVRWHLLGRNESDELFVIGVYPMLLDETCFFLAMDFNRVGWQEDALALVETCRAHAVPAVMERSRSGNGAHVWFFFSEAIPAVLARRLGSFLLTKTMERRPDIGFASYDRLFPNQDTLPKGGFGNLIALPLQGAARKRGNSVFVKDDFSSLPDQWAFLSSIEKVPVNRIRHLADERRTDGDLLGVRCVPEAEDHPQPWLSPPSGHREPPIQGPLPKHLEVVLADQVYIGKEDLSPPLRNRLIRLAAFQNPEFQRAQAMRLPTYDKPRIIGCAEDHSHHISLPRGCLEDVLALLKRLKIKLELRDERYGGEPLGVTFQGALHPDQQLAADALLAHETGVFAATTAFGKTVLAAWLIAKRSVNTLVLVHRKQLLEQWVERLSQFLDISASEIGRLGGGRKRLNGSLDVGLVQSFVRKGVVNDRIADYGHLVIDECHHISARSFELAVRRARARFVVGLSATVTRKDGRHPIIFMQCGPIRHRVDARQQAAARPFSHKVIVRPTGFKSLVHFKEDRRLQFQALYEELAASEFRNRLIVEDVMSAVGEGRYPLVLTERTAHLESLAALIEGRVDCLVTLRGGLGRRHLAEALNDLASVVEDRSRVVLATGAFIGEGFDDALLDTLFLALPVSWSGTIAQYVGRLHRLHDRKKEVRVFDYADLDVAMLSRMFDRRCRGYEAVGYTVLLPASAVPGWPVEVPLPVDPMWKRDYAASVQRLLRDGVNAGLARLFVQASRAPDEGAVNPPARSASEAFLFRRLESLPETAGRFQLNVSLPIPFAGFGRMEVDFCCRQPRLVIELDGAQHLESTEAYRRDRSKDALLQEHGFFVLRFLAEDLGKHLDDVLDSISRALDHLSRRATRQSV